MHLHVNGVSLCGVHVCILCLLILFTCVHILCALPPHTAYPMSVHGVHVLCMRVREGGGGKEGKIRLVIYARFSFPVADFVTHQ